jgi:hypothetical protein
MLCIVFKELKRWEDMPNRREPYTPEMLTWHKAATTPSKAHPLSKDAALADWCQVGLLSGLRLSEWAQDSHCSNPETPAKNIRGDTAAFCINDIRWRLSSGPLVRGSTILQHEVTTIQCCFLRWRTQKNGENGEEKKFTRNTAPNGLDLVLPMYSIVQRFVALRGHNDLTTPLGIFSASNSVPRDTRLIISRDIEHAMRHVASKVYNLNPKDPKDRVSLQLWSAHSLRVGAACILHGSGFTESQIKFLLRWKSNTFMMYLRKLSILSNQQNRALDTAAAMPNFI